MKQTLINYISACYPGIAIQTTEEQRVLSDILEAAKVKEKSLVVWSATEGMRQVLPNSKEILDSEDLVSACKVRMKDTVYVMCDIHTWPFDRDPILTRAFKDLLSYVPFVGSTVIILAPNYSPHPTFEKMVVVLDYTLPSKEDLKRIATSIASSTGKSLEVTDDVIRALGGFSTTEAENALALSWVETSQFDPKVIYREKIQTVKKSGLLEIVDPDPRGLDSVGGLDVLKKWILLRKRAFTKEAEEYGLPSPKGVLLVGVPGTGKSLSAKAIGTALGVPTVRLDIGALFSSLVGESEAKTRDALKLAEAIAPCVVWIDEVDKGLAGSSGSGANDSGVTKRVFGTIITWMQERKCPVFLVATANDVTNLPPEFLRRWDKIFAVDLPNASERNAIFSIHLKKRNREKLMEFIDVPRASCITETEGFSGSEIERVIEEAMFNAFDVGRDITAIDIFESIQSTVPLSKTAPEKIAEIRAWARSRATFASTIATENSSKVNVRKINA